MSGGGGGAKRAGGRPEGRRSSGGRLVLPASHASGPLQINRLAGPCVQEASSRSKRTTHPLHLSASFGPCRAPRLPPRALQPRPMRNQRSQPGAPDSAPSPPPHVARASIFLPFPPPAPPDVKESAFSGPRREEPGTDADSFPPPPSLHTGKAYNIDAPRRRSRLEWLHSFDAIAYTVDEGK